MAAKLMLLLISLICALLLVACRNSVTEAHETTAIVEESAAGTVPPDTLTLPNDEMSIKFAVIGTADADRRSSTPLPHRWRPTAGGLITASC